MRNVVKGKTLPNKLHQLVSLALVDLKWVEHNPSYKVNMGKWHQYDSSKNICYVCFAGAVMAHTLARPIVKDYTLDYEHLKQHFFALDRISRGDIISAISEFYKYTPDSGYDCVKNWEPKYLADMHVANYEIKPKKFKKDMRQIYHKLKALDI